jgi:hypothetical protein
MRKNLVLALLILFFMSASSFAGSAIVLNSTKPPPAGVLKPDVDSWVGIKYQGKGNVFKSDYFGSNINYITRITVKWGTVFYNGKWQPGTLVEVVTGYDDRM